MLRFFAFLGFCVVFIGNAHAFEINNQGAQTVKTMVDSMLDYQKKTGEAFETVSVEYSGEVQVEQMADYYVVTLPQILLKPFDISDETQDQNNVFMDLGTISMSVAPDENDGYWKAVLQFPSQITLKTVGDDSKDFVVQIGAQNTIAMLSERLGYFTKVNMNLSDISFSNSGQDIGFSLGGLQFYQNFDEDSSESFSGPYSLGVSNITFSSSDYAGKAQVGELRFEGDIDQMKMPTLAEYQDRVIRFAGLLQSMEDEAVSAPHQQEFLGALSELYDFDLNGISGRYVFKDVKTSGDEGDFSLEDGSFGFEASNLKSDAGGLRILGQMNGFSQLSSETDGSDQMADIAPRDAKIDVRVEGFPYQSVTEMVNNTMQAVSSNPEMAQMAGLGMMMKLPALFTQSGTKVTIDNNGAKNDIYDLSLNGNVLADLKAMMGFTSKITSVFEGLDPLIELVGETKDSSAFSADIYEQLTHFKTIGVSKTGPNGKPAYEYVFEVTPDGQMLLNGQDAMSALPQ